jgi:hypothetical protein
MNKVLERFDATAIRERFEDAGVLSALEQKGFGDFELIVESAGLVLPHALLFACKDGRRFLLLDACVGEAVVRPDFFQRRGYTMDRPVEFAVVHWVREQDPSARFTAQRPQLPLQQHPGLGVLRRVFRVVAGIAQEIGKDGVMSVPKFFHDAVIFFRSRLFLFLDPAEQGRLEALQRDLRILSLGDASLALAGGCVRDAEGTVLRWAPGYQVFPISARVTAYFHSPQYGAQVGAALNRSRFVVALDAVAALRERWAAGHRD